MILYDDDSGHGGGDCLGVVEVMQMLSGNASKSNLAKRFPEEQGASAFFPIDIKINTLHKIRGLPTLCAVGYKKHLLIDASNVLHAWPETQPLMRRGRDVARERLSQRVRVIHDAEQIRVTLVFDGRGGELVVEHSIGLKTFSHIFTPVGTTADDVIEQLVSNAVDAAQCIVVTDDRAERDTIEAAGATHLSAADLATWVTRTEQRQKTLLATRRRANEKIWKQEKQT